MASADAVGRLDALVHDMRSGAPPHALRAVDHHPSSFGIVAAAAVTATPAVVLMPAPPIAVDAAAAAIAAAAPRGGLALVASHLHEKQYTAFSIAAITQSEACVALFVAAAALHPASPVPAAHKPRPDQLALLESTRGAHAQLMRTASSPHTPALAATAARELVALAHTALTLEPFLVLHPTSIRGMEVRAHFALARAAVAAAAPAAAVPAAADTAAVGRAWARDWAAIEPRIFGVLADALPPHLLPAARRFVELARTLASLAAHP